MKNHKHTNGIRTALFASFLLFSSLNLSAQYKLELEWIKNFDGMGVEIFSIFKPANDSLFYFTSWNQIYTMKSSDVSIVKIDTMDYVYSKVIMSSDGKTIIAKTSNGGENGIGLLEPFTFKRKFWIKDPSCSSISYNEKQNKFVANYSPDIRVYDVDTQKLDKEYKTGLSIYQANLTDDGEHLIYTYSTTVESPKGVFTTRYYLRIMDLEGNILKEIKEIGSGKFSFTNDGKTLIYFDSKSTHLIDLETFQDNVKFEIGGDIKGIELSSDGKFMLVSKGIELYYLENDSGRIILLNDNTSWKEYFKINSLNNGVYYGSAYILAKFKIIVLNTIINYENNFKFNFKVDSNLLHIDYNNSIGNYQFIIFGLDGSLKYPHKTKAEDSKCTIDISNLASGIYFLQVTENSKPIANFKFSKIN